MLLPAVTSGLNASGAVGGRARTDHDGDPRLSHGQWRARRLALAAAHRADVVSARGIIIYRPGGPTTGLPHEWILALKQVVVCLFFLVAVACGGGGSSSPTAPTPTPTPPPPPPPPPTAQLQSTGRPSFTSCVAILGTCYLDWSIQNVGPGCAVQTTAVARLYDAADAQVGSDVQMGSVQVGLSSRTIRPNEIVSITSTRGIERQFVDRTERVRLFPTWSNAACP